MTFIEAAVAVLEQEGRSMSSREIADKAVALGILSHVGKTPVQTMSARISASVAKDRDNGPFVRVGRGVFALAKWNGKPPGPSKTALKPPAPPTKQPPAPLSKQPPAPPSKQPPAALSKKPESRTGMAPLAASAASPSPEGDSADAAPPSRKRKRKKRSSQARTADTAAHPSRPATPAAPEKASHKSPPLRQGAPSSGSKPASPSQPSEAPAPRPVTQTPPSSASVPRPFDNTPSTPRVPRAGIEDLMDRVEDLLRKTEKPVATSDILRGISLSGPGIEMLLEALIAADGLDRESHGQRARFVKHRNGYRLLEREISSEIIALERQSKDVQARLVHIAEKQVLKRLRSLSMGGFARVMITYLHRSGFCAMVPVDLASPGEFHLSVQDRRHRGRFRTAVVLRRDPADYAVSERIVMDLRGSIHHYDAMGGMILTTGKVMDQATREGQIANLPPVAIIDGDTLARELVRLGIGINSRQMSLPAFDEAFFSSLE